MNQQQNPLQNLRQVNFDPLHACNVTNSQQQINPNLMNLNSLNSPVENLPLQANPNPMSFNPLNLPNAAQIGALYRDLYNRLLALQSLALSGTMQQSPASQQMPSYNSVTQNALAAPLQSPQDAHNPNAQTFAPQNQTYDIPFAQVFAKVEADEPEYFAKNPVRAELKDYICQNCGHLHDDEITKILNLAKNLENQAVETFKTAQNAADAAGERQKLIQDANRAAISKLATNSSAAKTQNSGAGRVFTRAQISAMSPQEFKNNQAEIFAQYSKGLIK